MRVSERGRVAHVLRRLSMGTQPALAVDLPTAADAVRAALDRSGPPAAVPRLPASTVPKPALRREILRLDPAFRWWFGRMASPERMIEERLTWFWTDHFAVGMQKVISADLMWKYHATIRRHAVGSFADLLHAVAKEGAMLLYLDGFENTARHPNENFAREVMELHTLGRGLYAQRDVVEMARACTGWVARIPAIESTMRAAPPGTRVFASFFVPRRHDARPKTLFGTKSNLDLDGALELILGRPATARFVAAKLYAALVGTRPDAATLTRIATTFFRDWSIAALIEAIVEQPAFLADDSVNIVMRSPLEKLIGLLQAANAPDVDPRAVLTTLQVLGYVPFFPPNPGGYPKGVALLGPQQLVHTFDLASAAGAYVDGPASEVLERFGIYDATSETRAAIERAPNARVRTLLALGAPEFAVR